MAVCDKWVALKVVEFLFCVACLVAKRVSTDDEARLALLLQKLSREWSLLNSVTWDSVGGAFADAVYGGYVVITSGLLLARIFAEVPRGRRILEGWFLGMGMLFFLVLGGLELASIDTVPYKLIVNASVLGALSLVVAALFLLDLMGPRIYTAAHHSQTDVSTPVASKKVSISTQHININGTTNGTNNGTTHGNTNGQIKEKNGRLPNGKQNGHIAGEKTKEAKNTDVEKGKDVPDGIIKKDESRMFDQPKHGYTKFDEQLEEEGLARSKYGSLRNEIEGGNYIRLSDPLADNDRLHYERELAKFNEKYFRDYLEVIEGRFIAKEDYLPEPQTPQFAKVKTGRLKDLYDDASPTYEKNRTERASKSPSRVRTVATPTLQQLEDYLKESNRSRRADTPAAFPMEAIAEKELDDGRASGTPTDPGFVRYSSDKWPDKRESRTPRHSPTH